VSSVLLVLYKFFFARFNFLSHVDLYTPKGDAIKILSGTKSGTPPNGFILTAATLAVTDTVRIF
jgi:hypothetical protein